jgi:hypothetical protein
LVTVKSRYFICTESHFTAKAERMSFAVAAVAEFEGAGAPVSPSSDVGLGQSQIEIAAGDGAQIVGGVGGGLGYGDQARHAATAAAVAFPGARRIGDGVGDETAEGEVRGAGGAGADTDDLGGILILGHRGACQCRAKHADQCRGERADDRDSGRFHDVGDQKAREHSRSFLGHSAQAFDPEADYACISYSARMRLFSFLSRCDCATLWPLFNTRTRGGHKSAVKRN